MDIQKGEFNPAELLMQSQNSAKDAVSNEKASNITTEKELTPLQKAIMEKENRGKGVILSNKEIEEASNKGLVAETDNEQRRQEFQKANDDLDNLIKAAPDLVIEKPSDDMEMVEVMSEIEEYANTGKIPEGAKMIRLKTDAEKQQAIQHNPVDVTYEESQKDTTEAESTQEVKKEEKKLDSELNSIVEVLIDKTGLGVNIDFSDEERAKMRVAKQIKVSEVEDTTLKSIKMKAPKKSFVETIAEHQISTTMTQVMFPASGFAASMKGLSFGELGDIALTNENMTFAKLNKKLSVLYNNITNSTIGKFESYEHFLRSIAYTDIPFAVFGLTCSTFPEHDNIVLNCQKPECKKQFEHSYSPRSLVRFDAMSKTLLKGFKAITDASNPKEFKEVHENSFLKNRRTIELPASHYLIEVGVASAYEYLHETMNEILDDKFVKEHPDDVNGTLVINTVFLSMIRAVSVPIDGEYVKFTDVEDIVQALYTVKPEDIPIIVQVVDKYIEALDAKFTIKGVKCPHCKTVTEHVPIDIDTLVFQKYQTLTNTRTELEEMLDL